MPIERRYHYGLPGACADGDDFVDLRLLVSVKIQRLLQYKHVIPAAAYLNSVVSHFFC